jgi:hypothetical protein
MEEIKKEKTEKLSYEELEKVAQQLSAQAQDLYEKLQQANLVNMFKRLDYLFKVVENEHAFSTDFVMNSIKEIEEIMTLPKEEPKEEPKTEE